MLNRGKLLGQAKIRKGAGVSQDFHFFSWKDNDKVFNVYEHSSERNELIADGYGNLEKPDSYGNGALYVKIENLIWEPGFILLGDRK